MKRTEMSIGLGTKGVKWQTRKCLVGGESRG